MDAHGKGLPGGRHVHPGAHAARDLLEGDRPPVGALPDDLAVEDEPLAGQRQGQLGHLRQPVGDLVQGARVDPYVRPVAMHLDADPVQLLLHRAGSQRGQRLRHGRGRAGEHRLHGPADPQGHPLQRRRALGEHRRGHPGQGPVQHHGAAQGGGRHPGGRRHRVQRDGVERALAHLAEEQTAQEALLGLGGRAEQGVHDPVPLGAGTGARDGGEFAHGRVDLADGEGRPGRGVDLPAEGAPSDAGAALGQPPGEVGDDDGGLLRGRGGEHLGEQGGLRRAGGGLGDLPGHTRDLGEQHADHPAAPRARAQVGRAEEPCTAGAVRGPPG